MKNKKLILFDINERLHKNNFTVKQLNFILDTIKQIETKNPSKMTTEEYTEMCIDFDNVMSPNN